MTLTSKENSSFKILIVENEGTRLRRIRDILVDIFENKNVYIRRVGNALHGEIIIKKENGFDLLITDECIPKEGDGIMLASVAKKMYPSMSVIMLTGVSQVNSTENIDIVIKKSEDFSSLIGAIKHLLKLK